MAGRRPAGNGLALSGRLLMAALLVLAAVLPRGPTGSTRSRRAARWSSASRRITQPFGFRDATGAIVGYDVDVARGLADKLGVELRLVAVTSANRLQKLAAGEIDAVVATLGDTVDRRRVVRMVEPGYYGGGAGVLVPELSPVRTWTDLRNRSLCAVQGALWNRLVATRLNARIEAFGSVRDAELGLRDRLLRRLAL